MRVRVWIHGANGPSHDFELVDAPRAGDRIAISVAGEVEEGTVASVSWQLQGIERTGDDLAIEGEPVGTVTMVHVICTAAADVLRMSADHAEVHREESPTTLAAS